MKKGQSHRVDDIIQMLMNKSSADIERRILKVSKNVYTFRDKEIRKIHQNALKINVENITDNGGKWFVASQSNPSQSYTVTLLQDCATRLCLKCRDCGVCYHMVMCNCVYYERGNLCKHIHAVCFHNPRVIAARFRKLSREEELKELPELQYHRTESHLSHSRTIRATAQATMAAAHTLDDQSQTAFFQAVVSAFNSPKTPRSQPGFSGSQDCNTTPKRKMSTRMEKITPQRRSVKKLRIEHSETSE